jgi:hypothetical protein
MLSRNAGEVHWLTISPQGREDICRTREGKGVGVVHRQGAFSCSAKNKLEMEWSSILWKMRNDVDGLPQELNEMAFTTGDVQNKFWTLQNVMRRLTANNQGPKSRSPTTTRDSWSPWKVVKVVEAWCCIHPTLPTGRKTMMRRKRPTNTLSMIFLAGTNNVRYGKPIYRRDEQPVSSETRYLPHRLLSRL